MTSKDDGSSSLTIRVSEIFPVIKPEFSEARSFVGKLAHVTLGMSDDEALYKALKDHQAGKSKEEIEKELKNIKTTYGLIDRTGKFVWSKVVAKDIN